MDNKQSNTTPGWVELSLLLSFVTKNGLHNEIAEELLEKFGSLLAVFNTPANKLKSVAGVTIEDVKLIKSVNCIARSLLKENIKKKSVLNSCKDLKKYCRALLRNNYKEEFRLLSFSDNGHFIDDEIIAIGTTNQVVPYLRDIALRALQHSASKIVIVHSHPSDNTKPSPQDIAFTNHIRILLLDFKIDLYDHIIVSLHNTFSFRENKLINDIMRVI
jgi:DNA repair protein RadC